MCCCYHRWSSGIQLWLILHPNCITKLILSWFYLFDLMLYNFNPKKFLQERGNVCGQNYAALGKIIAGDYNNCAEIIRNPQKRGYFLGRARLHPNYVPDKFLLFLSDKGVGGSDLHQILHTHMWEYWASYAMATMERDAGSFDQYLNEIRDDKNSIYYYTIKSILHAFSGKSPDEKTVEAMHTLFVGSGLTSSFVVGALRPFTMCVSKCMKGKRRKLMSIVTEYFLSCPAMEEADFDGPMSVITKEEYSELFATVCGVAGTLGTSGLITNLLNLVPDDANINFEDDRDVLLAMLEAARIQAPVNNVNVILTEEAEFFVNRKNVTLPQNTVVAASIGLASLDPNQFHDPNVFNHKRENLINYVLNFNSIGFDHLGVGTRVCPGRNAALAIAKKVFIKSKQD